MKQANEGHGLASRVDAAPSDLHSRFTIPGPGETKPALAPMHIAFFGSSLVSAYWNGAATYYRGIIRALHARGHRVTFYEPDALGRQQHRDMDPPPWAEVVVYSGDDERDVHRCLDRARAADVIVKASGVGVFDELLEAAAPELRSPGKVVAFWDVDAPATLQRLDDNPDDAFIKQIGAYDMVLTYGGGPGVIEAYLARGARACNAIYNAADTSTHHPVAPERRFACDLAFLGNRLPDREARVEQFFLEPAMRMPGRRFILGGSGWADKPRPTNVRYLGHVYTRDHNALNASPTAVLNVSRESMARAGHSPATRLFEAAAAGACIISDAWPGLDAFLEPGREVLVAESGDDVIEHLARLTPEQAGAIGSAALRRVIAEHTYDHRARQLERLLQEGATA
ncbi:MAG: glycosyltransferase [Phycisphaeraceae bacterium]